MKKLILILIPFFFILTRGFAQFSEEEQQTIDSLNNIVKNESNPDTSRASAYLDLSGVLYVSNLDTMIPLCNEAEKIARKGLKQATNKAIKTSFLKTLSGVYNNKGFIYYNRGQISKGLKYILISLDLIKELGDKEELATGLNNVGYIYNDLGEVEKAIEYYHKSLKLEEEIGNKQGIATSLNNLAFIYDKQGNIEKSLEYYYKSLAMLRELKDKHSIARSLNNIGSMIEKSGDLDKALEHYQKSLYIGQEINNKHGIAISFLNIGLILEKKGDLEQALDYYHKSLKLREEIDDKDGLTMSCNRLANLLLKMDKLALAKEYALKSFTISKELGFPQNIQISAQMLSQVYEQEKNGMLALEMHKLSIQMRDSINNQNTQQATALQQARYDYEKQKTIDDANHQQLLNEKQDEKERQKILTYSTAGILLLVVVFLLFVFNRLQITRKQKQQIELQNTELEIQKKIVEEKNEEITDSIYYAKRIQAAILPPDKAVKESLPDSFILYKPKDIVAGDFYWLEKKNGKILFAACDCTGHGVPGAMVSVVCVNGLNRSVREHGLTDPAQILEKTREIVIQEFEKSEEDVKDGMDISLCVLEGNRLQWAGANNPLWIIRPTRHWGLDPESVNELAGQSQNDDNQNRNEDYKFIEIKPNKQPIGKYSYSTPFHSHTLELQKGDSIYIFSDGYADQFGGEKGKKFKLKSLKELLLSVQEKGMSEQKQIIDKMFEDWKGNLAQIDDVCIIGVRIC
ncbi:MAG: tetratricopeptide repeat protein [Bacteroidetes bacterium]|nr:tetratricopeptide repeat protein [Bacteroidota bacterium]